MIAISPLNDFRSRPLVLTTEPTIVYTTPIAVSTIVLSGQVSNVGNNTPTFTASVIKARSSDRTRVIVDAPVPPNDALIFIEGRFVLEEGDSLEISASVDNELEFIMSYLETSA